MCIVRRVQYNDIVHAIQWHVCVHVRYWYTIVLWWLTLVETNREPVAERALPVGGEWPCGEATAGMCNRL